jgi:hypothetical protein
MNTALTKRSICVAALIAWAQLSGAPSLAQTTGAAVSDRPLALSARDDVQGPIRTAQRLQGLDADVRSLYGLATRHREEIRVARESLQDANNHRYASLAFTVLLAMLTGGAAAFLWHRARRSRVPEAATSWYGSIDPPAFGDAYIVDEEPAPVVRAGRPPAAPTAVEPDQAVSRFAVPAMPAPTAPALLAPMEFALADAAPTVLPTAAPPSSRKQDLNVDALLGAQQQAEFFGSLGQFEEALAVLTGYLEESGEKPVLAFFELFRICHGTGQRSEYEHLQSRFRHTFGMDMAGFDAYQEDGRELDQFPMAVKRIARAWPSEESQQIIEEMLFRKPATQGGVLSLRAYRDLLWLYGLGQDIVSSAGAPAGLQSPGGGGLSNDHFILPWAADEQHDQSELSLDRLQVMDLAGALDALAVDLDLTVIHSQAARAAPPTEPAPLAPTEEANAFDQVMDSVSRKR